METDTDIRHRSTGGIFDSNDENDRQIQPDLHLPGSQILRTQFAGHVEKLDVVSAAIFMSNDAEIAERRVELDRTFDEYVIDGPVSDFTDAELALGKQARALREHNDSRFKDKLWAGEMKGDRLGHDYGRLAD